MILFLCYQMRYTDRYPLVNEIKTENYRSLRSLILSKQFFLHVYQAGLPCLRKDSQWQFVVTQESSIKGHYVTEKWRNKNPPQATPLQPAEQAD